MMYRSESPRTVSTSASLDALRRVDSLFSIKPMYHWPGIKIVFRHRATPDAIAEFHDVLQGADGRVILVLGALEGPDFESEIVRLELLALVRGICATARTPKEIARAIHEPLAQLNRNRTSGVYCHFFCGTIDREYTNLVYCQAGRAAALSYVTRKGVSHSTTTGGRLGQSAKDDWAEETVSLDGVERLILGTESAEMRSDRDGGLAHRLAGVWGSPATKLESWDGAQRYYERGSAVSARQAARPADAVVSAELPRSQVEEFGPLAMEQVRKLAETSDLSLDPCVFLG